MASNAAMMLHDHTYSAPRYQNPHHMQQWYSRGIAPFRERMGHASQSLNHVAGGNATGALIAAAGTLVALSAVRHFAKNDNIPIAAELGAAVIGGAVAFHSRENLPVAVPAAAVGLVGTGFVMTRLPAAYAAMKAHGFPSSTAQLPARPAGTVAGEFGEDPIIRAARNL